MNNLSIVRPELLVFRSSDLMAIWPLVLIFSGILIGIVLAGIKWLNPKWAVLLVSLGSIFGAASASFSLIDEPTKILFNQMLICDSYSHFFYLLFSGAAAATLVISSRYLEKEKLHYPEYYLLVLFSLLGMMLLVSSLDLIVLFIALEIMSLAVYVLVGFRRSDRRSNEAAMKYFILGSAASAIFLYGVALVYGVTASTDIKVIHQSLQQGVVAISNSPLMILGCWLLILGFLFKVASVPFHMWMPDVYEGAPVPITGFMTSGLKAAAFATFLRVFHSLGYWNGLSEFAQIHFHHFLWISAALTMFLGNLVALTQTNLKRLLAYSSIAHTGYLMLGFIAGPRSEFGDSAIVLYLAVYAIMNVGVFAVLSLISRAGDGGLNLHDLSGLSQKHPWLAFVMAVFILSMAGIPPTAGFAAKYYLFYSAVQANEILLVVLGILCSAISVFYYLRILVYMYMKSEPLSEGVPDNGLQWEHQKVSPVWTGLVIAGLVALIFHIGIMPERAVAMVRRIVVGL